MRSSGTTGIPRRSTRTARCGLRSATLRHKASAPTIRTRAGCPKWRIGCVPEPASHGGSSTEHDRRPADRHPPHPTSPSERTARTWTSTATGLSPRGSQRHDLVAEVAPGAQNHPYGARCASGPFDRCPSGRPFPKGGFMARRLNNLIEEQAATRPFHLFWPWRWPSRDGIGADNWHPGPKGYGYMVDLIWEPMSTALDHV